MKVKVLDKVHAVGPVGVRLVRETTFSDGSRAITDHLTAAAAPAPKRVPLEIASLLARAGIKAVPATGKLKVADLDAAFAKAGMSTVQRMRAKAQLVEAGLLD
jgi:hypothetical protein